MLEKRPETNALGDCAKISVFVVAYNRESIIGACLAPLSFADELIVIDKSSTDSTAEIATHYAHRVITVPWSPVVEETRTFALDQCKHDWILFLDDDECLSAEAIAFIKQELQAPRAEIYGVAQRQYILGVHDERAYYWPEFQPRLFRRGAVSFARTVHSGYVIHSKRRYDVPPEEGVCVHHLSHRNVEEWIAKANRYTSMQDRARVVQAGNDLIRFGHDRIDFWRGLTRDAPPNSYPMAIALLRATYDIIDRLKVWEQEEGLDGDRAFRDFAAVHQARFAAPGRSAELSAATPPQAADSHSDIVGVLRDSLRDVRAMAELVNHINAQAMNHLREMHDQRIVALEAEAQAHRREAEAQIQAHRTARSEAEAQIRVHRTARSEAEAEVQAHRTARIEAETRHDQAVREVEAARSDLESIRASSSWRLTAPLRGFATRHPRLARLPAAVAARHPSVARKAVWLVRNAWRVATFRPPVSRASLRDSFAAGLSEPPTGLRAPGAIPVSWFYVGDTLEWIAAHQQLTGVGKVTTEILAAGLSDLAGPQWQLCVMQGEDLAPCQPVRDAEPMGLSPAAVDFRALLNRAPAAKKGPQSGDHVLFTGVVWTPTYAALFERLRASGVRFSVLVYDIIPVECPEFVSSAHAQGFARWLRCVLREAELIFVSTETIRTKLYRWSLAEGIVPRNPVCLIPFGHSLRRLAEPNAPPVVTGPFVLCVGTIDRRKNQLFLCQAWAKLAAERPVPTLVLVGRDDLGLARADAAVSAAVESGQIQILAGLDDAALDALYRTALLTVFPSLNEGYGLPVADSLGYGKLCLAADLPVIRESAGDLPWYFDPRDEDSLIAQLRRALDDVPARVAAEARIVEWHPHAWLDSARVMASAISDRLRLSTGDTLPRTDFPVPLAANPTDILDRAQRWCVADAPEVSIIVVNWNATELTCACVRHLWANTTGVRYEILVVDNGSAPEGLEVLRGAGSGLRLLRLGVNRYFGEANNIAVEAARGRYVCLLNNDVFVSPGWLEMLLAGLRAAPEAGAVGPVFLFPDGTIQEAGGKMNESGFPERLLRGLPGSARAGIADRYVDYISAACLLMPRALFLQAGGFDLAYEPAYYEDADLCFKLAVLGCGVKLVAAVDVVHLEGFSTGDNAIPSPRKLALGDLNRGKFVSRWGNYLRARDQASLKAASTVIPQLEPSPQAERPGRRALIYSPYPLTPGGGESYLLTLAAVLTKDYAVTVAAQHPYSQLRLLQLSNELGIDLSACAIASLADLEGEWDLMVAMGNHIVPPVAARAQRSLFHCQFPFPLPSDSALNHEADRALLVGYGTIVVNSHYTKRNAAAAIARHGLPPRPIRVLYPPVRQVSATTAPKRNIILTVGRFFEGGHSKRHDKLIEAFRALHDRHAGEVVEFHLAGSSKPEPEHMDYLTRLQDMARDLPVKFHVNATPQTLNALYQQAAFYWHGTGLDCDLEKFPELAEHFGIAIVEAMSAGCVAFALDAGAAPEIIKDGVDGCLYSTRESLVQQTVALLQDPVRRDQIGVMARLRAADFAVEKFIDAAYCLVA